MRCEADHQGGGVCQATMLMSLVVGKGLFCPKADLHFVDGMQWDTRTQKVILCTTDCRRKTSHGFKHVHTSRRVEPKPATLAPEFRSVGIPNKRVLVVGKLQGTQQINQFVAPDGLPIGYEWERTGPGRIDVNCVREF